MRSTRVAAALGVGLVLTAGGATAFAATDDDPVTTTPDAGRPDATTDATTPDTAGTDDAVDTADDAPRPERGEWLDDVLGPLVEDGTLTEEQLDAVIAALEEAGPFGRGERGRWGGPAGPGPRGDGPHRADRGPAGPFRLDTLSDVLGLTAEEIRDALRDGTTIAELAEEHGIDVQTVIDALVSAAEERITDMVVGD